MHPWRLLSAILIAAAIQIVAGCAAWQTRNWDLSQLRDPRVAELDDRMSQRPAPVTSPFSAADGAKGADAP